ncbi:MAG: hypothetical protein Q8O95_04780 [bacterium]|nr:hypothetical protein [bacterium]
MWQILLERFLANPWWGGGSVVLFALVLAVIVYSFFRNVRRLSWYYGAALIVAVIWGAFVMWVPGFLESLVVYRTDWSLVYLVQAGSASALLSQLVFYLLVYGGLAVGVLLGIALWSVVTFRLERLKSLFRRSFSMPWGVILFSLLSLFLSYLWILLFEGMAFDILISLLELMSFLFVIQYFIRLVDTAYLNTPQIFMEFVWVSGLMMLFVSFLFSWSDTLSSPDLALLSARNFFFHELFVFFLGVLLLGFLTTFLVRSVFASQFFLEHSFRRIPFLSGFFSRLFSPLHQKAYGDQRVFIGIVVSVFTGFFFLMMVHQQWYLLLVPFFFLGYFVLFCLLDRQEDMRVRGDILEKR